MAGRPVSFLRTALLELVQGPWRQLWLVSPALHLEALRPLLPHLEREGGEVMVLTDLSHQAIGEGRVELAALKRLKRLPGCEVRWLTDLGACVYAAAGGSAVVGSGPLTPEGLEGSRQYGVVLDDSGPVLADVLAWWESARRLSPQEWLALEDRVALRRDAYRVGAELSRLGAFVRVSARGTRRSRRLDPKDFGVLAMGGVRLRPMDVTLCRLDVVSRAKDDLDALLAEKGLEWNGQYLVPRRFLEQEWPAIFAARERQLAAQLDDPEQKAALEAQLREAREVVSAFLGDLCPFVDAGDTPADAWVREQCARLVPDDMAQAIRAEAGLEYRVLTILPEDRRSVEELDQLLQHPRLRSVQLTFPV
ncbi:hypothetical protein [Symbiobacterium terraclitae]|uniref:hypothetical protein n=1 Tax=Symbiobacterium terraclitae TaxID=557451 RepID=UPI0035B52376